jgi:TIR domain
MPVFLSRRTVVAGVAAGLPAVLGSIALAPPWPPAVSILTSVVLLVFLLLSVQFPSGSKPSPGRFAQVFYVVAVLVIGGAYSVAYERFTFELPTTGGRIALGCGFTPEAADLAKKSLIETAGECPGHYEDLLEAAQYEAHFIWTKRSIATVRLGLLTLWGLWFGGFALLVMTGMKRDRPLVTIPRETPGAVDLDVFVSYAREDHDRVERLVRLLEGEGFKVWWDPDLAPGQTWDTVLEARLASARCVVVVWSAISVTKRWVLEEASKAADRRVLVPVRIENVEPPFGFSRLHAASLIDWDGSPVAREFRNLVDAIAALVHPTPSQNRSLMPKVGSSGTPASRE